MDSFLDQHLFVGIGILVGLAALCLWNGMRPSVPLPPGPSGNLLFGTALELGRSNAYWLEFAKYTDQYGPIVSVRILSKRVVIISDPKIGAELFERRAAQYSDRIITEMAKLVGWDRDLIFIEYGPTLKHYRTLLHRAFNNRAVLTYLPLQEHEVKRLMRRLWESPEEFMRHIHLMAGSVAIRVIYGYKVDSQDDPLARSVERVTAIFGDMMSPGRWMVDAVPILRHLPSWFPGATFHSAVASWKPVIHTSEEETFDYVKQQLAAGTAEPSFVSKLLQPESGEEVDAGEEVDIKRVAFSLYGAASDTTTSAVQSFFLAMTLYPDVQAKAQAEIAAYFQTQQFGSGNNQIGPAHQFITMADRPNLPYTSALVREVLRWHPVLTLIAHRTCEKDDDNVVVDGKRYRIPAYTAVVVNAWSILHNPDVYPDPDKFVPERYLVDDPPPGPEMYAFGIGRRACPGLHVAQQSMWLSVSNTLANFTITKAKDENGVEIVPEEIYTNDAICHPVPFKCNIQPRKGCERWLSEIE